ERPPRPAATMGVSRASLLQTNLPRNIKRSAQGNVTDGRLTADASRLLGCHRWDRPSIVGRLLAGGASSDLDRLRCALPCVSEGWQRLAGGPSSGLDGHGLAVQLDRQNRAAL